MAFLVGCNNFGGAEGGAGAGLQYISKVLMFYFVDLQSVYNTIESIALRRLIVT